MRPGRNGEVILEVSRDRRYVRKAARVAGNLLLAEYVDQCADVEYSRLYWSIYPTVDARDISSARATGLALPYAITEFKSAEDVRCEIAGKRAYKALAVADIHLDPIFTPIVLEEVQALAELSKLRAITLCIRRSVAQDMLAAFPV